MCCCVVFHLRGLPDTESHREAIRVSGGLGHPKPIAVFRIRPLENTQALLSK